ncbi:MAG: radical SAM protein [Candidatus Cloacimonetes bacterium]|nr:radical SAM protein [Bacteroidota bacterium]MBL7086748.1 radical SAM protein [Candidatus Cloacimonadota bacterium]
MENYSFYINITYDCNNDCIFCASNSDNNSRNLLSADKIISEIEKYDFDSNSELIINGGEPTVHKELFQILSYFNSKLKIIFFTNGRKFSDINFSKEFFKNRIDLITVPFYTNVESDFENLTNRPNSFKDTTIGLKNIFQNATLQRNPKRIEIKLLTLKSLLPNFSNTISAFHEMFRIPDRWVLSGIIYSDLVKQKKEMLCPDYSSLQLYINNALEFFRKINYEKELILWSIPLCSLSRINLDFYIDNLEKSMSKEKYKTIYINSNGSKYLDNISEQNIHPTCSSCQLVSFCMPEYGSFEYIDKLKMQCKKNG